jgi:outer membrane immunogenic protein
MNRLYCFGAVIVAAASFATASWGADMNVRQPAYKAPPMAAAYNWTGCYVGGHVGYGWANEQWNYGYYGGTDFNTDYGSHTTSGVLAGGQVGCNYQTGIWVFGLEGDFSWTDAKGNHDDPFGSGYHHSTNLDWVATATARLGIAFDRSLLYVKGGAAWDSGKYNMLYSGLAYSDRLTRTGWTVGAGWEYGLTPNWSVKIEYNYLDFGKDDVWWDYQYANDPWSYHVSQRMHVVKGGINYRFGGAAYPRY